MRGCKPLVPFIPFLNIPLPLPLPFHLISLLLPPTLHRPLLIYLQRFLPCSPSLHFRKSRPALLKHLPSLQHPLSPPFLLYLLYPLYLPLSLLQPFLLLLQPLPLLLLNLLPNLSRTLLFLPKMLLLPLLFKLLPKPNQLLFHLYQLPPLSLLNLLLLHLLPNLPLLLPALLPLLPSLLPLLPNPRFHLPNRD